MVIFMASESPTVRLVQLFLSTSSPSTKPMETSSSSGSQLRIFW